MTNKIGIDFHGVISDAPEMFAIFCEEIRKCGVKVFIITGGPEKDIINIFMLIILSMIMFGLF